MRCDRKIFIVLVALTIVGWPFSAMADSDPRLIGTYGDWNAYVLSEGTGKVCYMTSMPKKAEGNYTRRGDIYALVTHWPSENSRDVFSYVTGYAYKTGSDVTLKIDSDRFILFTQDETAWAQDADTDRKISMAIRKGSNMVVTGTSSRGTKTTDTFSLKGSSAAYSAISKECGLD